VTDPDAHAARSAAAIIAPSLGPALPAEVEAALGARDGGRRPARYLDPVSLADLIVSIASHLQDGSWKIRLNGDQRQSLALHLRRQKHYAPLPACRLIACR
jgi:hypothetical protein